MKKLLLISSLLIAFTFANGQKTLKTPGLLLGLDSTFVVREYTNFNNQHQDETWQKVSMPGRIIYYCQNSSDKNKSNVAHIYDFDDKGINFKYTTITTQEKIKYAVDHFNNLTVNRKNLYKFEGTISGTQAIWTSNDDIAELAGCNCGHVKVTVISNLNPDDELVGKCGVKPGRSGELLAIVYTPNE
jgi:hypothetical protein